MNEEKKDTQARKYLLTINNPEEHGFIHEVIKRKLEEFKSITYWCMCDEIGLEGTYHTHLFLAFNSCVRWSTIKKAFPVANINGHSGAEVKGTCQQNRDYIRKEGKWENDKKKETNLPETFEEFGQVPFERPGQRNDITEQYDMVKQGLSNYEIMEQFEGNVDLTRIDRMRLTYLSEKYKSEERDMKVIYVFGPGGSGKTSGIFKSYGYENVYKIDDWRHPFDSYNCEPVLLMDDWRSGLTLITDILHWLDKYPLKLPCRYANRQACYSTVYITSNEPLETVYNGENTKVSEETRKALLRRIHEVWIYEKDYSHKEYSREDYFKRNETGFVDVRQYNLDDCPWKID